MAKISQWGILILSLAVHVDHKLRVGRYNPNGLMAVTGRSNAVCPAFLSALHILQRLPHVMKRIMLSMIRSGSKINVDWISTGLHVKMPYRRHHNAVESTTSQVVRTELSSS